MLPGTGRCGAGLPPFPTACWWVTHPAAITGVSVSRVLVTVRFLIVQITYGFTVLVGDSANNIWVHRSGG